MPTTFNDPNFKVFIHDVELRGVTSVSKVVSLIDDEPDSYLLQGIHIKSESGFDTTPYIINLLGSNDVFRYSITIDTLHEIDTMPSAFRFGWKWTQTPCPSDVQPFPPSWLNESA